MTVIANWYGLGKLNVINNNIDWVGIADMRVMLCTVDYSPNIDTHQYKSDITNEVTGTGYDAGGKQVANRSAAYDSNSKKVELSGDDVSWQEATFTARYAVVYNNDPATDAEKHLLGYVDFGEDKSITDGEFRIEWHEGVVFESELEVGGA